MSLYSVGNNKSTFEVTFSKYMSSSSKILYRINSIRYEIV